MAIAPTLNVPQARFLAMQQKFKAYVAGFGSGKTWVGCGGICKGFWEFPKINQGYFAPTYPQIRDIFYPTVEEVAHDWGLKVKIVESNKEVHFYSGRQYRGTTICRSMEKPDTIVGFKIGNALVDELDVLKADKARQAWRKIIARMRYKVDGLRNGIDVTTTPEGFKFVYNQFVKAVREKPELRSMYGLVQASTFDIPPGVTGCRIREFVSVLVLHSCCRRRGVLPMLRRNQTPWLKRRWTVSVIILFSLAPGLSSRTARLKPPRNPAASKPHPHRCSAFAFPMSRRPIRWRSAGAPDISA